MEIRIDGEVEKFITTLEESAISKVLRTIDLLGQFGYQLGMPHSKKVMNNVFELRIRGQQEVRIFYFFQKCEIILAHAYIKKSQKIPKQELKYVIKKARSLT